MVGICGMQYFRSHSRGHVRLLRSLHPLSGLGGRFSLDRAAIPASAPPEVMERGRLNVNGIIGKSLLPDAPARGNLPKTRLFGRSGTMVSV
jgi:hypothetical protein